MEISISIISLKWLQLAAVVATTFAAWDISSSGRSNVSSPFLSITAFSIVDDPGTPSLQEEEEGILEVTKKNSESCKLSKYDPSILEDPCKLDASVEKAPDHFSLVFPTTSYGTFTAKCERARAPVWVDRVYKLALNGYYNSNYFFRVIPGRYTQFGTNGNPETSNVYNYTSTSNPECSILDPQPPFMPYCMASKESDAITGNNNDNINNNDNDNDNCDGVSGLSNDFGTVAMSTSYKTGLEGYPNGVTWNATAELFINTGNDNQFLDSNLFVPICTIAKHEMETVVLKFPSFGEVSELGGNGPSLGKLYEDGNTYIESNLDWKKSMAVTGVVQVCP